MFGRMFTQHNNAQPHEIPQTKNLSVHVSTDSNLPLVEHTTRNQSSELNNCSSRSAQPTDGTAPQRIQLPTTMLKPVSITIISLKGKSCKNKKFDYQIKHSQKWNQI